MPDNTAAGPSRDQRDERDELDERGDVTRTPGTSGARGVGDDTVREGVVGREAPTTRGGSSAAGRLTGDAARTGSAARDDVLGGRDTAAQERAREGREAREAREGGQDTMVGGRIPAVPRTPEQDRSPAREGGTGKTTGGTRSVPSGAGNVAGGAGNVASGTGKTTGGRSGASREGILGAEARVNAGSPEGSGGHGRLMPHDEGDKWSLRLQHAVTEFVDSPRGSVEEADQVLQEVAERITEAVTRRRSALGTTWQTTGGDKADTEQLRLALKDYRELTERLLKI